jgi:hypothetical protein
VIPANAIEERAFDLQKLAVTQKHFKSRQGNLNMNQSSLLRKRNLMER